MREKGNRKAPPVTLSIDRSQNQEHVTVAVDDAHEPFVSFEVEPGTRKVVLGVNPKADVEVLNAMSGEPIVSKVRKDEKDEEGLRNWAVVDGKLKVWLPNGNAVELDIMDEPGPFTPKEDVFEVLGQPHLIFAIALGIKLGKHTLLSGPTGIAKTTAYRWFAKTLNYNLVVAPIARGTESSHLIGEYLPSDEAGNFDWTDGPVTQATRLSQDHPTLLVLDEINRIGNIAELARVYSLLDDQRFLELKEKRNSGNADDVERVHAGRLYIGATSNPSDDEHADYIGVQDLDPALNSRFTLQPPLGYPLPEIEAAALAKRVDGLQLKDAEKLVATAKRIREAETVRFPISFRELEAWALTLPFFGWKQAAEISVVSKAAQMYQKDIRNLVQLQVRESQAEAQREAAATKNPTP